MVETMLFKLGDQSKSFATRTKGRELFDKFIVQTYDAGSEMSILDWAGVNAASPSFIDEIVGRCCEVFSERGTAPRLAFTGSNPSIIELLDAVLKRRGCQVIYADHPDDVSGGNTKFLGVISPSRPILV